MRSRFLLPIPLVILAAGCAVTLPEKDISEAPSTVTVQVTPAANEEWPVVYEATGTVRARTAAVISARLMAYVREVKVETGDHVREGQMLVTLDARDLDASSR